MKVGTPEPYVVSSEAQTMQKESILRRPAESEAEITTEREGEKRDLSFGIDKILRLPSSKKEDDFTSKGKYHEIEPDHAAFEKAYYESAVSRGLFDRADIDCYGSVIRVPAHRPLPMSLHLPSMFPWMEGRRLLRDRVNTGESNSMVFFS